MAIVLFGLCCFLSINPAQSSPVEDDAEEEEESDAGDEEGGDEGKEDANDENIMYISLFMPVLLL